MLPRVQEDPLGATLGVLDFDFDNVQTWEQKCFGDGGTSHVQTLYLPVFCQEIGWIDTVVEPIRECLCRRYQRYTVLSEVPKT